MKKVFLIFSMAALVFACNNSKNSSAGTATADVSDSPAYNKGLETSMKYDCSTCHKIEEKIQGPSYKDIANKYAGQPNAVSYLSDKIIKGGSGVWGNVAMAAHPNMPKEDAEAIVNYILLLKR